MTDAKSIIETLGLLPHPEGGYYIETYRSGDVVDKTALPRRYDGDRCASTAIYYLLGRGDFSALHRLRSDEIFHFYLGGPVETLIISPEGRATTAVLGTDLERGHRPQLLVPKGSIQGMRPLPETDVALLGATVSPGFDFADFELISREQALRDYPHLSEHIVALTREHRPR
jgi:predicted cupin superfamily sugar epimerase